MIAVSLSTSAAQTFIELDAGVAQGGWARIHWVTYAKRVQRGRLWNLPQGLEARSLHANA